MFMPKHKTAIRSTNVLSWVVSFATFLSWGAVTASLVAWGLAIWPYDGQPLATPVAMDPVLKGSAASTKNLNRILGVSSISDGAEPDAPSVHSRLVLVGIAKSGTNMAALIAVDGQAAKLFAKGMEVLPGLLLQSVSLQQAHLGAALNSPPHISLDMPNRAEPARGWLQ